MLVIDSDLAELVEGVVMIILAARDHSLCPSIGRSMGAAVCDGPGGIDLFVAKGPWPDLVYNASPGAPIAATFSRPTNYETFQIKGVVTERMLANANDHSRAEAYIARVGNVLAGLGVSKTQMGFLETGASLHRIRFEPEALFRQTPGPGAGDKVAEGGQ